MESYGNTTPNEYLYTNFEFDEKAIESYVVENGFEAIAITNHIFFDEKQFENIVGSLKDTNCLLLPGIEITLEGGHILVIGENCAESINVFKEKLVFIFLISSITFFKTNSINLA